MTDFTKEKIAFAVALLAVLFTLTPIIEPSKSAGFSVFGIFLSIWHVFYFLSAALGMSVYCYGLHFLVERQKRTFTFLGDVLYAIAVVAPVAYLFLYFGVLVSKAASYILRLPAAKEFLSSGIGVIVGVLSSFLVRFVRESLARKERNAVATQLELEERTLLRRAEELLRLKHYDLVVVESYKAVEVAIRKALLRRGMETRIRPGMLWVDELQKSQLIDPKLLPALDSFRRFRNLAAHHIEPVSEQIAVESLATANKIIAGLSEE